MIPLNDKPAARILSLGAGVQSSAIAYMIKRGELEPVDAAIFADTGCEPAPVYRQLRWLQNKADLPFPVLIVSAGNLATEMLESAQGKNNAYGRIPLYVPGKKGFAGRVRRQCTLNYKIDPIDSYIRKEVLGLKKGQRAPKGAWVEQVIGISWEERHRARQPSKAWQQFSWPLIEKKMRRYDCLVWIDRHGYPTPPRSACTICPNRSREEWRWLQQNDPEGWRQAVTVDRAIRGGMRGISAGSCYLHRSLKPLDEVDVSGPDDWFGGNLFDGLGGCQGACGL